MIVWMKKNIFVKGARTHNLKNINIEIPRKQMDTITGLSGSGKSSLINALANQKKLARISQNPGRTQQINFFQSERYYFVKSRKFKTFCKNLDFFSHPQSQAKHRKKSSVF